MFKKVFLFFDKFEDSIRKWLSHYPLLYAFIGGAGVIIFWRGVWYTMDFIMEFYFSVPLANRSINSAILIWWDGPLSIAIGLVMLLATGIFTSSFIGNEIIISGIKGEKKMVEKTELEMQSETESVKDIKREIEIISDRLEEIETKLDSKINNS